jgi:malate permease and related proteins
MGEVTMTNFLLTISYLAIGKILSRFPRFPEESAPVLNQFIIHVALPALILLKIPELVFSRELLVPALLPWVMLVSSAAAVLLGCRLFRWSRETTGALLLLAPLGNTAFLGIPMVTAFFGEEAVPHAVLYDQLGSFPALVTYGSAIIAIFSAGGKSPSASEAVKRIVTFPPFIALLLAFTLRPLAYPEFFTALLQSLAATLVPVVMIAVGFRLTFRLSHEISGPLAYGLSVKMIMAPAAALMLATLLDLQGLAVQVSIFQAGMPPMVLAGALALAANLSPRLAAAMVGLGILASFVTLPILYQFL